MLYAVLFYDVVKWIHIMAVVVAFGGAFTYPIWFRFVRGAPLTDRVMFHRAQAFIGRFVISPGLLVIVMHVSPPNSPDNLIIASNFQGTAILDGVQQIKGNFVVDSAIALTSLSAPRLSSIGGTFNLTSCTIMASLSLRYSSRSLPRPSITSTRSRTSMFGVESMARTR